MARLETRTAKYQLGDLLGRGGMAEVYRADMVGPAGFRKEVCVKKIREDYAARPDFVEMFQAEARIIATMHHENVVEVHDFDFHQGELILVMEYVDGVALDTVLKEANRYSLRVPLVFVFHVMEGLLAALGHAHTREFDGRPTPVVHRDVSPQNLLISKEGVVKLTDFGVAKARGLSDKTQTGVLKGKPAYFSPEQVRGEPATPALDLFSAGALFWEMLHGEQLFKGLTYQEIILKIASFEGAELSLYAPAVDQFFQGLTAPALRDRFESASAALAALRRFHASGSGREPAIRLVKNIRSLARERKEAEESKGESIRRSSTRMATQSTMLSSGLAEPPRSASPPARAATRTAYRWILMVSAIAVGLGGILVAGAAIAVFLGKVGGKTLDPGPEKTQLPVSPKPPSLSVKPSRPEGSPPPPVVPRVTDPAGAPSEATAPVKEVLQNDVTPGRPTGSQAAARQREKKRDKAAPKAAKAKKPKPPAPPDTEGLTQEELEKRALEKLFDKRRTLE